MKMLIGLTVGLVAAWLYSSKRARQELQQRLSETPTTLQELRHSGASLVATGAQRAAEIIDSAPLSDAVKDAASGAAFNVWVAADTVGQPESSAEPIPGDRASIEP